MKLELAEAVVIEELFVSQDVAACVLVIDLRDAIVGVAPKIGLVPALIADGS